MEDVWKEADSIPASVKRGDEIEEWIIYKGIKIIKNFNEGVYNFTIFSTDSTFYNEMKEPYLSIFKIHGFKEGVRSYNKDKYKRYMKTISKEIQSEIDGDRNYKRMKTLKKKKNLYIKKYNEA